MKLWIDADACPKDIRKIVVKASKRLNVPLFFVANKQIPTKKDDAVTMVTVSKGFDEADERIIEELEANDVVVTDDVPLAAQVVAKGGFAITPRGNLLTDDNIHERLATRNLLQELRSTGIPLSGPAPFNETDKRKFANTIDSLLTKLIRETENR